MITKILIIKNKISLLQANILIQIKIKIQKWCNLETVKLTILKLMQKICKNVN